MMKVKSPFRSGSQYKIKKSVKTIWTYSRQLFSVSGVNGVSHIAQAKTSTRRILWIALFSMSITGWFYQTTTLLEYYYKYPTVVKIDVEKPPVMTFPGLTICNVNKVRRSQFCKEYPERCALNESIQLTEEELFDLTFEFLKRGEKLELGHQLEDTVVSCEFSGNPRLETESCLKYFSYIYDPHLGNCFVMSSHGREKLTVTEPDAWKDIEDMDLVLNVEHDEYLDPETDTPGLIIAVHEDNSYPHVFAHGIHVYAEHTYNLAVEMVTVHLLPHPYKTNCTDYHKLPFTALSKMEPTPRICTVECLIYHQHKECGHGYKTDNVVLYSERLPYNPDQVTEEDKKCAESLSEAYKDYCSSLCSVPCHDVHFTMNIDSSPTSDHKVAVNESVIEEYKRKTNEDKQLDILDLKIHYQTMEHRTYRHSPEYTTEELFSYLGGITGGWLGISLLEFLAFVEGVLSVFMFSFRSCKPKKCNKKKKGKRSPRSSMPAYNQCECQCRQDFGSLLLAFPVANEDSPRTVQVVPYGYY